MVQEPGVGQRLSASAYLAGARRGIPRQVRARNGIRRELIVVGGVVLAALALRLGYIFEQRGDILFEEPVLDEEKYVLLARSLVQGHQPSGPWFQPPGIVYVLAFVFRLFGTGLLAPRVLQALVSTGACALAYIVARRLLDQHAALLTAAICAVHGVLVFESYELLAPTWMLTADLLMIWLLLRAIEVAQPGAAFGAGLALGLSVIMGPTVLPFGLVAAWGLRRPVLVGAFVAGCALVIAPVTWGNWERAHEFVIVSTNGGVNLYLGNSDRYYENLAIRPGPHWEEFKHAGTLSETAADSYYRRKALGFWLDQPVHALGLYIRKLYLYFDGPEIPRDTELQTMRRDSWILELLVTRGPPFVPDGLLIPLSLVGAVLAWRDRRRLMLLYGFVIVNAFVTAAFFVTSRYRVPALPMFAMFASEALRRFFGSWSEGIGIRQRLLPLAACALLAIPLNVATRESRGHYVAELDYYRGLALLRRGNPDEAVRYLHRATEQDPSDARYWLRLGDAIDAAKHPREAIAAWHRAADLDPWEPRARRREAVALMHQGDLDGAIAALRTQAASHARDEAFYAQDHMNLAMLYARRAAYDRAVEELRDAQRADPHRFGADVPAFTRAALSIGLADDLMFWGFLADGCSQAHAVEVADEARRRAR